MFIILLSENAVPILCGNNSYAFLSGAEPAQTTCTPDRVKVPHHGTKGPCMVVRGVLYVQGGPKKRTLDLF